MNAFTKVAACMTVVTVIGCGSGDGSTILTGGGGGSQGGGSQGGTGAGGSSACSGPSGPCKGNSDCCGYATSGATEICLSDDSVCHATCTSGSQCQSGCCVSTTVNGQASYGACVAASHCTPACSQAGASCTKNSDCCGYAASGAKEICLSNDNLCHATCTSGSQCASGCCVQTSVNGVASYGACAAASNCG